MTDDDKRAARRVPVVLRIKLRYKKVDTFISKFATNISSSGMFISSRKPKAIGTEVRFELRLSDESPVVSGKGMVKWVREYDADRPRQPHGMGIEFTQVSAESRALIDRIVQHKRELGVEDDGAIPREEKKAQRAVTRRKRQRPITYTPRDASAEPAQSPANEPPTGTEPTQRVATTDPELIPDVATDPTRKLDVVEPRPAQLAKPPAPLEPREAVAITSVDEVIARATANAGSSNGEDWSEARLRELIEADVPSMDRALARARELAGDVDDESELAKLTRVSATAVANSVDNASDALASILGGNSVTSRRQRRAKRADPMPQRIETETHPRENEFPEGTLDVPLDEPVEAGDDPASFADAREASFADAPEASFADAPEATNVSASSYVDSVAQKAQAAVDSAMAAADALDESIPDFADIHNQRTAADIDIDLAQRETLEPDPGASDDAIPIDLGDLVEVLDATPQPPQRAATIDAALAALESDDSIDEEIPLDIDDSGFGGDNS